MYSTALKEMEKRISKKYGDLVLCKGREMVSKSQNTNSTGLDQLDIAIGNGGIPKGSIIEIHGTEQSGKTALALHIVKQFLKKKKAVLYADAECSLCTETLKNHGIKGGNLFFLDIETLEDTFSAIETAIPAFDLIVIDSLPALPTKEELVVDMGNYCNYTAKKLSHILPRIIPKLTRYGCTLIVINQFRDKVSVIFGNPEYVTSGRALKYFTSISMCMRKTEDLKSYGHSGKTIGQVSSIAIVKNKYASPYRKTEVRITYGKGMT